MINQEINAYFFEINESCKDLKSLFFMILNYYGKSETVSYFWKRLLLFPPKAFKSTLTAKINMLIEQRLEIVKEIVASDMKAGRIRRQDVDAVALLYSSAIHGLLSSRIIYKSENLPELYERVFEALWNGIN